MIDRMAYTYKFPSGNRTGVIQKDVPDTDWTPPKPSMYSFYETGMPPIRMTQEDVLKYYGGLDTAGLLKLLGL